MCPHSKPPCTSSNYTCVASIWANTYFLHISMHDTCTAYSSHLPRRLQIHSRGSLSRTAPSLDPVICARSTEYVHQHSIELSDLSPRSWAGPGTRNPRSPLAILPESCYIFGGKPQAMAFQATLANGCSQSHQPPMPRPKNKLFLEPAGCDHSSCGLPASPRLHSPQATSLLPGDGLEMSSPARGGPMGSIPSLLD